MRTLRSAAVLLAALVATAGMAADTGGHPDLSGFWGPARSQHPYNANMVGKLPANTVMLDDTGAVEFPQREFGGLKIKPAALAEALKWKPEDEMTVARTCAAPSIVYAIQGPFPFEIHQTRELIVFRYE